MYNRFCVTTAELSRCHAGSASSLFTVGSLFDLGCVPSEEGAGDGSTPQDANGDPGDASRALDEVKLMASLTVGDEMRKASLELKQHDRWAEATLRAEPRTGTVDDTGLLILDGGGTVDGFARAEWSKTGSRTRPVNAPCGTNNVEIVQ